MKFNDFFKGNFVYYFLKFSGESTFWFVVLIWIEILDCGVKQYLLTAPLIWVVSVGVFVYVCVAVMLPRRSLTAIVTVSAICSWALLL